MALNVARITAGTTAASLRSAEADQFQGQRLLVTNRGGAAVFLGPASVTTTDGFELAVGQTLELFLEPDEDLFVVAAAAQRVDVLRRGV